MEILYGEKPKVIARKRFNNYKKRYMSKKKTVIGEEEEKEEKRVLKRELKENIAAIITNHKTEPLSFFVFS